MSAIILLVLRILLALLLYGFLGIVLVTLWRDIRDQSELVKSRQPTPIILNNEVDNLAASRQFTCAEIILGRDPTCDFHIDDQTVSSRHARLSFHQTQWWLEDLASTNGTYLNEDKVTLPTVITQGDLIRLGQVGVTVEIGEQG